MSEWEEDIDVPAVEWPSDGPVEEPRPEAERLVSLVRQLHAWSPHPRLEERMKDTWLVREKDVEDVIRRHWPEAEAAHPATPSGSGVCAPSAGGSVPADPDGLNNPIRHWPNDPTIPGCNEHCHRAAHPATDFDNEPQSDALSKAEGLDVERLADALEAVDGFRTAHQMKHAARIAAEYARLSSPKGQEK